MCFQLVKMASLWDEVASLVPDIAVLRRLLFAAAHIPSSLPMYPQTICEFAFQFSKHKPQPHQVRVILLFWMKRHLILIRCSLEIYYSWIIWEIVNQESFWFHQILFARNVEGIYSCALTAQYHLPCILKIWAPYLQRLIENTVRIVIKVALSHSTMAFTVLLRVGNQ